MYYSSRRGTQMSRVYVFALIILQFVAFVVSVLSPRKIVWSETSYGPDGPWQAVTVSIGNPSQPIDLFPGGFWASNVLESSVCNNTLNQPVCYAQAAGLYNSSASVDSISHYQTGGLLRNTSFGPGGNVISQWGTMVYRFDDLFINSPSQSQPLLGVGSFDMHLFYDAYSHLPDGTPYPIQVGNLALGAPDPNQTWIDSPGKPNINGTFLPSNLFERGVVESNSWGMHIGSAELEIPGSLYIGGYDQSRVLGSVSVQQFGINYLPIDLLDIGIGVALGESPFNFTSKSGLLAQGNSSLVPKLATNIDPTVPYLYLPKSTCNAIAQNLPVTYKPKYGLYFWDTTSSLYQQIVTSPAFLSFTFRYNESITQNITINVPFALLNLTMTAPLVGAPGQYFPCSAAPASISANGPYALGRAFLQAAFVGLNWQTQSAGRWFLAQAPGPNTPSTAVEIAIGKTDNYIVASTNSWAETWNGIWTPIANGTSTGKPTGTSTSTSTSTSTATSGLSTGATIGIGIGVGILALVLISTAVFYIWRWKTHSRDPITSRRSPTIFETDNRGNGGFAPRELEGLETKNPVEIDGHRRGTRPVEMLA